MLAQACNAQAMNARARSLLLPLASLRAVERTLWMIEVSLRWKILEITAACPNKALLKWGLHPEASDRLRWWHHGGSDLANDWQCSGPPAGYHAQDGTASGQPTPQPSTFAQRVEQSRRFDRSCRRWVRMDSRRGIVKPGSDGWPASEAPHSCGVCGLRDEVCA